MKLARHRVDGTEHVAVLVDEQLANLTEIERSERSMLDVLRMDGAEHQKLCELARFSVAAGAGVPLGEAELLAPITAPPKYLAMAFNGRHDPADLLSNPNLPEVFRERLRIVVGTNELYPAEDVPVVFNKQTSCIIGPRDDVWAPSDAYELDYEGELVIVIGKRGRRLAVHDAPSIIAGFTVGNDVSIRDWQFDTPTHWMGKSFETFGPVGPVVVTPDELDPDHARIRTWVNEELRQDGSTDERKFKVAEIVSWISQRCTLEPGDLIATGTGGGLAQFTGRYMKPGDVVSVEIPEIGRLENKIVPEPIRAGESLAIY